MIDQRALQKQIRGILSHPEFFPDEFKSWLPRFLETNPNVSLSASQLPSLEATHYVANTVSDPPFGGTWGNYGSGYEAAGYFKDFLGVVHLVGVVAGGVSGTTIYVLPAGYRPAAKLMMLVVSGGPDAIGRVDIWPTGEVVHVSGAVSYFQLDNITFRAFA